MSPPTAVARRFIYGKVAPILTTAGWTWTPVGGVAQPRLFHGVSPGGVTLPYVVFQLLSPGNDARTQNGSDVWSDPLYLVKAVCAGTDTTPIEAVVQSIDAALNNTSGSVTGGVVMECWRVRRHELPESTDGKSFSNLGGEYRLLVQGA